MDSGLLNAALANAISGSVKSSGSGRSGDRKLDIHSLHSLSLRSGSGTRTAGGSVKNRTSRGAYANDACMAAPPASCYVVDPNLVLPQYNYDFEGVNDTKAFYRGGVRYYRPCGWYRFALNVNGKYDSGDDSWLGGKSNYWRYDSASSEWPVAYHGTIQDVLDSIAGDGFDLSKVKRDLYGKGIYCTPDPSVAEKFSKPFTHNGVSYKTLVQVRVRPNSYKIFTKDDTGVGEYWLMDNEDDLRPYGICTKEVN